MFASSLPGRSLKFSKEKGRFCCLKKRKRTLQCLLLSVEDVDIEIRRDLETKATAEGGFHEARVLLTTSQTALDMKQFE